LPAAAGMICYLGADDSQRVRACRSSPRSSSSDVGPPLAGPSRIGDRMRYLLLPAVACAAALLLSPSLPALPVPARCAPQDSDAPEPSSAPAKAGSWLELGRTELRLGEVEQGSRRVTVVKLTSVGTDPAHVARVSIRGEGATAAIIFKKVRRSIVAGEAIDPVFEVERGRALKLELTLDPAGLKLGQHAAMVEIETDGNGGKPIALPVDWEIVEKDDPAPAPASSARERGIIKALVTKGAPPHIEIDPIHFDFGHVMLGERIKTNFKITNNGEGDLILQKIGRQCHCTLPRLVLPGGVVPKVTLQNDEMVGTLKKGESATLEVEIDTNAMGGPHEKSVTVFSNDLTSSPFPVKMQMVVDNPFAFEPSSVNFEKIRHGSHAQRRVRMSSAADVGPFSITGYELPQPPAFDIDYRPVKAKAGEVCAFEIVFTARDDAPCKRLFGKLRLDLEHAKVHAVQLDYFVSVQPDVDWIVGTQHSPESISLGVVRSGQNDVRSIILENRNEAIAYVPTKASVESRLGAEPFATEIVPLDEGKRYEVKLKIVKEPPTPAFSGDLVIASDHPTVKELRIRFNGFWRGR
jgi:hypothetical protein